MSDPLSQVDLERKMLDAVQMSEHAMHEIAVRGDARAKAHKKFKEEYAKALLRSTRDTVGEREAEATIETGELFLEFELCDARKTAAIEASRSIREQQSTLRSINANHRDLVTGG